MAAVAHVLPADLRRLSIVRTGPFLAPDPPLVSPATVYRRRRIVALLVVVTVVAGLVLAIGGLMASFSAGPASSADRPGAPGAVYVVQPGDTFWEIARRLQPGEDPRPLVARMVAAHGSPSLRDGERLPLPVAG